MITLGSLFSGIGGFELGLERAIPGLETIWQVEQEEFCQRVLQKHWPNAEIYNDVKSVGKHNLQPIDIICGGFPCQDISIAGKKGGIHGKKSGFWWEMHRIISELRPRIAIMENVPNLLTLGLPEVLGSLSQIGYDTEWCIVSASQFGAPHLRKRIFIVAYSSSFRCRQAYNRGISENDNLSRRAEEIQQRGSQKQTVTNSSSMQSRSIQSISTGGISADVSSKTNDTYWGKTKTPSPICYLDDGIPDRLAKLRALGNAIVPQCSEWVGQKILNSGLLDDLLRT
mgnify:CR=1 FL=1|tara:strand:+ start:26399 stop:27250 length:852 start_codon:yes stop_codon:yes gene_type:complete